VNSSPDPRIRVHTYPIPAQAWRTKASNCALSRNVFLLALCPSHDSIALGTQGCRKRNPPERQRRLRVQLGIEERLELRQTSDKALQRLHLQILPPTPPSRPKPNKLTTTPQQSASGQILPSHTINKHIARCLKSQE
jgi:hypothetical protein